MLLHQFVGELFAFLIGQHGVLLYVFFFHVGLSTDQPVTHVVFDVGCLRVITIQKVVLAPKDY